MIIKRKTWIWDLTIFAHSGITTTIGETIYLAKNEPDNPDCGLIRHERIHIEQQKQVGVAKFVFLYLLCLPFLWNPWRFKWEMQAYTQGTGVPPWVAKDILRSWEYGFLLWH
jgi:hypothetical protein